MEQRDRARDAGRAAPPSGEGQAAAYVSLCERLLAACESATLSPVKQGVQTV